MIAVDLGHLPIIEIALGVGQLWALGLISLDLGRIPMFTIALVLGQLPMVTITLSLSRLYVMASG